MSRYKVLDIPIDLLRRSSRIARPVISTDAVPFKTKRKQLEDNISTATKFNRTKKRIKSETSFTTVSPTTEKHDYIESSRETKTIVAKADTFDYQSTNTADILLKPDGFLEVTDVELDLERTLMGGQSFRWIKKEKEVASCKDKIILFTGVIGEHALQLWRSSQTKISFRLLNEESRKVKISSIREILEDYFQLKYNLETLYKDWSSKDTHLANCCIDYKGFRILRQDPVENVFSFICATNNNIKRISQMVDKLCKRYGNILESDSNASQSVYDSYQSFPPVERLAQDDVFQCLRYELGFGYRAKFINETAKQILKFSQERNYGSAREYLLSLRKLPYKETCKELMKFPGIGRKVADCICLMSMDHLNAVPIDCHIYEIVCKHYLPDLRQKHKTLTENVHDMIGNHFKNLHGPLAGWSTSVLFIGELKHLKVKEVDASLQVKKRSKSISKSIKQE